MNIFITGTAGFIGYHLADLFLRQGHTVHGYDGITDYYDIRLKQARHQLLRQYPPVHGDGSFAGRRRSPAGCH